MSYPLGQRLRHVLSRNNLLANQSQADGTQTTRFNPSELRDLSSMAGNEIHDVE